jgi:hypothetical protein
LPNIRDLEPRWQLLKFDYSRACPNPRQTTSQPLPRTLSADRRPFEFLRQSLAAGLPRLNLHQNPAGLKARRQLNLALQILKIPKAVRERFPEIKAPGKEVICYATQNRQESVKQIAPRVDLVIVV